MAFVPASAALGLRADPVLSADNAIPERHIVIDLVRRAAPLLGLKAPVIATLDAMLSCLPPRRSHHTVFASNATLSFRQNGISDRTLRRHFVQLQEAGLLARHDSPNRKRFVRSSATDGTALRFGFDLAPLYARLTEVAQMAAEAMRHAERVAYLKCKLRAAVNRRLEHAPDDESALRAHRKLRCKLGADDLESMLETLNDQPQESSLEPASEPERPASPPVLSASDGQNVRHHHKSNKELIDNKTAAEDITVSQILTACPEPAEYSLRKIQSLSDVMAHARMLAPMVGIAPGTYDQATRTLDPMRAALAVWIVVKFHDRIRSAGAYFRSLTLGARSASFDPYALIGTLSNTRAKA